MHEVDTTRLVARLGKWETVTILIVLKNPGEARQTDKLFQKVRALWRNAMEKETKERDDASDGDGASNRPFFAHGENSHADVRRIVW